MRFETKLVSMKKQHIDGLVIDCIAKKKTDAYVLYVYRKIARDKFEQ